jgi:hypothetical protein
VKDWTRHDTPRTWHFWAIWAAIRLVLGLAFYALGLMPALWFLLGELVPDAAWYWKDERMKELTRGVAPMVADLRLLELENERLRAGVLTYEERHGRSASISSITTRSTWTATSKNSH